MQKKATNLRPLLLHKCLKCQHKFSYRSNCILTRFVVDICNEYKTDIHIYKNSHIIADHCSSIVWYYALKNFNTLRPRQIGRHFADDIFNCIFLNENVWIPIRISLKFVPKGPINNIPALVQIMAWRRPGDKPLSESMMVSLPTHICVTRPQWVNSGCVAD